MNDTERKANVAEVLSLERLISKQPEGDFRDFLVGLLARFRKFARLEE